MKNALYVDFESSQIIMTRTFAKKCRNTNSAEYTQLQSVRRDYPIYSVVTRQISTNPEMEHYHGLTYAYMEEYIETHGDDKTRRARLNEFREMIHLSKCHSKRYPVIKRWFLEQYPEIAQYGMPKTEEAEKESTNVTDLPVAV